MRFRHGMTWLVVILVVLSIVMPHPAAAATPQQVKDSIRKAVAYLYKNQANGNWEKSPARDPKGVETDPIKGGQWGGITAMCTYALLASGESPQEDHVAKAIEFLKTADLQGVYALGMRLQVWKLLLPAPEFKPLLFKDAQMLRHGVLPGPDNKGFFGGLTAYPPGYKGVDRNMSQFGVMGLWAAAESGVEIPDLTWTSMQEAWRKTQMKDGGWGTSRSSGAALTAAGIASLFDCEDELHADTADCTGNTADPFLDKAIGWMSANFEKTVAKTTDYGLLFSIERIGDASGNKYFGTIDWYKEGAADAVSRQSKDGSWSYSTAKGYERLAGTAYCVLFLARGRAPVAFNKVNYAPNPKDAASANWNERPRDVAELSKWVSDQAEIDRHLNWQVVNLRVSVDELHDAPILYLTGNAAVTFSDAEIAKLRQFAQDGGLILCNSDCGSKAFTDSMRTLGETRLFPSAGEFRELPTDHPIYTHQQFPSSKWKTHPHVLGLSNGVRELMLIIPEDDPSRAWETASFANKSDLFSLGADILLYAVDRQNLYVKGDTYIVRPDPKIAPTKSVKVARLQLGVNWNPEPEGWKRLAAIMHNSYDTDLDVQAIAPDPGKLSGFKVAHLTGTTKIQPTDAQKEELKKFITAGGTIIVDAAGGSADFADSSARLLTDLYPTRASALQDPLPPDHAIYTVAGPMLADVQYRPWVRRNLRTDTRGPRLKGMERNGRIIAFYSAEDLSAGLVGENVDGIEGYSPQTATTLMIKLVMYAAAGGHPQPLPAATTKPK